MCFKNIYDQRYSLQHRLLWQIGKNLNVDSHNEILSFKKKWRVELRSKCKSRKSRDTWSNMQIWHWNTKQSRSKANMVLPRECTGHSKHPLPIAQEKTLQIDITRWSIWNQIDYILCSQRWRSSIQSAKARLGADCGSDHELLIAKFRLKLKKIGKTTRPFRYDLNQIPYDYTVEVTDSRD